MLNDKDTPKKAVDATPPPMKARIAEPGEGKPDYYNNPPTDYVSRHRLVDRLKATPGAAKAVVRYWKEQQIAWPEPPNDYLNYFKHLTESSEPDKYLSSIEREDSDALLGWLGSRISDRVWEIRTAEDDDLDALAWWELLGQRVTADQQRRAVSKTFWEDIRGIVFSRLSEYPKDAKWGGVAELRATVARLHLLVQNLKQYEDEPAIIKAKVADFIAGWEQRVARAHTEYLEAARNHRDGTPKVRPSHGIMTQGWAAMIAERDYKAELFRSNVHQDYLRQHFDLTDKPTKTEAAPEAANDPATKPKSMPPLIRLNGRERVLKLIYANDYLNQTNQELADRLEIGLSTVANTKAKLVDPDRRLKEAWITTDVLTKIKAALQADKTDTQLIDIDLLKLSPH
jgi:DNA-binding CsgD family transcriptional regulator